MNGAGTRIHARDDVSLVQASKTEPVVNAALLAPIDDHAASVETAIAWLPAASCVFRSVAATHAARPPRR